MHRTLRLAPLLAIALVALAASGCQKKKPTDPAPAPSGPMNDPGTMTAPAPDAMAPGPKKPPVKPTGLEVVPDLATRIARFAPTTLDYPDDLVPPDIQKVLQPLIAAARVMDEIFLVQVDAKNPALRQRLSADPKLAAARTYFDIMFGPWDRREDHKPFIGTRPKPKGAGFYPTDMTKGEFEAHLKKHPKDAKAFRHYFTVIRRRPDRSLEAVPYSKAYAAQLGRAATLLREAAKQSKDPRLKRYLTLRAQAFASNDYRPSDFAWLDLGDGALEIVIGPYEVYEDRLFGYKAAFEAFINLRDPVYSARLAKISKVIPFLQTQLPIPPADKAKGRGKKVPISVVYELFTAGDTKAGIQTLAFNLPNDEEVRKKGFKLVLLKNVAEAKFRKILLPIAKAMMVAEQIPLVTFDAFFTNTLTHETAHGLGPSIIEVDQGKGKPKKKMDVNKALKELYSTIEEAKADIVGLWAAPLLVGKGVLPKALGKQVYASYLAGFFRSVRFGATQAHGRANLITFNYLLAKGGIAQDKEGRYRVDFKKIRAAVTALARDLLLLEARGNYDKAKAFITNYAKMSPQMKAALAKLSAIPVDLRPTYAIEKKMKTWK